ncbi:MAG: cytochrome c oxidase subunit II [Bryobacterales bacterium]|nr:cytochrome c oxidase subunit II [Bryobacterales bacterium]
MRPSLPLFPEQASSFASEVDALYFFLVALTAFFSVLIGGLVVFFAIKYRRRKNSPPAVIEAEGIALELTWSIIPLIISLFIFVWGASLYFKGSRPPDDAAEVYAVGKQWMWKIQHMEGRREINELHVPVGRAVKLKMTSEDVIHSFFVPAFRTKADVLPGRYTTVWFKPEKAGAYHLFCAEYCGTKHSGMIGYVYAMEPNDYQNWLVGGTAEGTLAQRGEKLFQDLACTNCHKAEGTGRGPALAGIFGTRIQLEGGAKVLVDEEYIRESALNPTAKVALGYQPVMPTFQGLMTEEGLLSLIEYIKSIGPRKPSDAKSQK